jgi:ABC-type hemin transport system ATPase subunit
MLAPVGPNGADKSTLLAALAADLGAAEGVVRVHRHSAARWTAPELELRHQKLVRRVRRERAHAGDAVVVALHDLGPAGAYAHRVATLCAGRVAADGPQAEVRTGGF